MSNADWRDKWKMHLCGISLIGTVWWWWSCQWPWHDCRCCCTTCISASVLNHLPHAICYFQSLDTFKTYFFSAVLFYLVRQWDTRDSIEPFKWFFIIYIHGSYKLFLLTAALMLQCLSVCRLWRYVLWLNRGPRAKVTIDSSYEVVYEKLIGTKMHDLDLCLEVV